MNRTNKGIVTLSFDCEAKWGMADLSLNWTKELTDKNDYFLEKSERYSHSTDYIEKLCIKYDYKILYSRDLNLRKENNKTTKASLYLLEF